MCENMTQIDKGKLILHHFNFVTISIFLYTLCRVAGIEDNHTHIVTPFTLLKTRQKHQYKFHSDLWKTSGIMSRNCSLIHKDFADEIREI